MVSKMSQTDGANPYGRLFQSTNGNFYGTTVYGGMGYGTIFKITLAGTLTVSYSFQLTDGADPYAGLVEGTDGNFYGATSGGGASAYGTVFAITPGETLTTLLNPDGQDGNTPFGGLLQGTDGDFYGTTWVGGTRNDGTVFHLSVGLGPFVKTLPHTGKVGTTVKILGTSLTGATNVTFHGAAAIFTVVSPSEIETTVPAGASTGKIQVTTPGGTLFSGGPFVVLP